MYLLHYLYNKVNFPIQINNLAKSLPCNLR
ncbi:hypothetical protein VPHK165_0093 [Vibrio phage K165]